MSNESLGKRVIYERICTRCSKRWFPLKWDEIKNKQIDPKSCPNPDCKSPYWNKIPIRPHTAATKRKLKKSWETRKV